MSAVDVNKKQVRVEGRMRQVQFEEITYPGYVGERAASELSLVMHASGGWGAVPLVDIIKYAMFERPDLIEQARDELASRGHQRAERDRMHDEFRRAFTDLNTSYARLRRLKGQENAGLGIEDGQRRISIHSTKLHVALAELAGEDAAIVRLIIPTTAQLAAADFRLESFKMWDDGQLSEPHVYPLSELETGLQWALLTEVREALHLAEVEIQETSPVTSEAEPVDSIV